MSDSAPTPGNPVSGSLPFAKAPLSFAKGHGTENDFVIVPDPEGVLEVPPQLVRALCDRRAGIGADGLLRVVRTTRIPEGLGLEGEWFMDYRNSDGSIAEMCGNGSRVFARYLVAAGLAKPGTMRIATRAGTKLVVVPDGESDITVDMGPAVTGTEAVVQVGGRPFAGIAVSMGNPHLVCGTVLPVDEIDLSTAPEFDSATFPTGVNVEVVNVLAGDPRVASDVGVPEGFDLWVKMRVYERGSGETRSCGTGACAVGAVALRSAGRSTGRVAIDVPGGRVAVTVTTATTLLEGPAVLVAGGQISPQWLAQALAEPAPSPPSAPPGASSPGATTSPISPASVASAALAAPVSPVVEPSAATVGPRA
ncbi:diaminopimelate epimerase [Cryptosporangium minutisporangium]|uniref:Diaminopimelate epimerase n=1 Tax=Cryptosporangium minutisporangium TaxID=113569 RepID=A0ABP6TDL3_9ACTN